jgi:hypothetical protein
MLNEPSRGKYFDNMESIFFYDAAIYHNTLFLYFDYSGNNIDFYHDRGF